VCVLPFHYIVCVYHDHLSHVCVQVDGNMPRSRKYLAVPFVGKDVPTAASEFAHPDIVIGLTVLAYRCGL
jgi:hypothetical protein